MSEKAEVLARHVSPDGHLVLRAERESEADGRLVYSLGFEGQPWHLHPDFFMKQDERSIEQMTFDLIGDVISDRMLIVIATSPGHRETRIVDTLESEVDYKPIDIGLTFRFWSGRQVSIEDLIDGRVTFKPLCE